MAVSGEPRFVGVTGNLLEEKNKTSPFSSA